MRRRTNSRVGPETGPAMEYRGRGLERGHRALANPSTEGAEPRLKTSLEQLRDASRRRGRPTRDTELAGEPTWSGPAPGEPHPALLHLLPAPAHAGIGEGPREGRIWAAAARERHRRPGKGRSCQRACVAREAGFVGLVLWREMRKPSVRCSSKGLDSVILHEVTAVSLSVLGVE